MRFLHTSDWHLGRQVRGLSRQDEFEAVLGEVRDIAIDEGVDAVIVAGDVFDTASPPPEAEELLYSTLAALVGQGIRVVLIAGNHDHAAHIDALAHVLRLAGIHAVGTPRQEHAALTIPSRDGDEAATVVAVPWIRERLALSFESLLAGPEEPVKEYADSVGKVLEAYTAEPFRAGANTVRVLVAHLLIDGAEVGTDGGERRIHIGQNFAVKAQALPASAQYIALGHVHRPQQIAHGVPVHYAGSLLQLDFGEEGQQKSVMLVEARPNQPAAARPVNLKGGRKLRQVVTSLGDLAETAQTHGEDYLRVIVELEQNVPGLFEIVRSVLPRAVEVHALVTGEVAPPPDQRSMTQTAPEELFARFYRERRGGEVPDELLKVFRDIYSQEVSGAPA